MDRGASTAPRTFGVHSAASPVRHVLRGTHEQAVTARQHHVRKEVSQLEAQRVPAQAHLNKAHRQIHELNLTSNETIPYLPNR